MKAYNSSNNDVEVKHGTVLRLHAPRDVKSSSTMSRIANGNTNVKDVADAMFGVKLLVA